MRPAEAVQALVLVADDAEVAGRFRQLQEDLLLDVICVLVFVHQHVLDAAHYSGQDFRIVQQIMNQFLLMGKIDTILASKVLRYSL